MRRALSEYWSNTKVTFEDFKCIYYCVCQRVPGLNFDAEKITNDVLDKVVSDELHMLLFREFVRSDYFLYIPSPRPN